ncbi:major facilitator superfamily domain-containing protein [Nemania sp. FL0916]|nr:major facilitator superfamily domain-containing protein [Nemania sp. FL0916]
MTQSHSSNSSSAGGQATPASGGSVPSPPSYHGPDHQSYSSSQSQSLTGGLRAATRAVEGDGDEESAVGEMYELKTFGRSGPRARDAEYGEADDGGRGVSARSRKDIDDDDDDDDGSDDGDGNEGGNGRRPSDSTVASFQLYTPDEEAAVVRKFDRRLVVFLAFCYMLSFVDRSNIGNARIAGMEGDLQSKPPHENYFEWALRAFYLSYIVFEWMSLLWRIVPAHIYVSLVVLSWGIIASLQAIATSYPFLIVLRALLGIGEAGFAGVPYYLSFFFKRRELAFRAAIFISAAPLASAFAGFVAWFILWVGKSLPIASWRLLFLIEGFPSVIVATIAWGVIPDSPETASYLSRRERKIALLRLRHEKPQKQRQRPSSSSSSLSHHRQDRSAAATTSTGLRYRDVFAVLKDPKAWLTAFMLFLANMAYSTLPAFLPTILKDMGHGALAAEALSAPPNLLAFIVVLLVARASDRAQSRAPFIAVMALVSASGYLVLALARPAGISSGIRYAAVYPAAVGFFSVVVLVIAWSVNNQPDESRRGGGFALLQAVGQCGPLLGAHLYPDRDAPFFETGMWACAAAMSGVAVLALVLRIYLARLNRALEREEGKGNADGEDGVDEEVQGLVLGARRNEAPAFRYIL